MYFIYCDAGSWVGGGVDDRRALSTGRLPGDVTRRYAKLLTIKKEQELIIMTKRCFVIMPFSETTEKHTASYWDNFFSKFVKLSIEKLGYSCSRSKAQPSNIIKDILKELVDADLVLAVLTDFNTNVWYELGTRHALRKGTIMIIEGGHELPFDISQYGVIKYEDTILGASDFEEKLQSFIQKIEIDKPADSPAMEFLRSHTRNDYQQRIEDMEIHYRSKLDKIVQLLQKLQEDHEITEPSKEKKPKLFKRKVLWVDDCPSNNEAIIDLYRQQGVEFDIALNTSQALDYLSNEEYTLVISDIGRVLEPDAGVRMIREIKRHFGSPPPILIFSSRQAIGVFGKNAKDEGASLITSSTRNLVVKMTEVLNL